MQIVIPDNSSHGRVDSVGNLRLFQSEIRFNSVSSRLQVPWCFLRSFFRDDTGKMPLVYPAGDDIERPVLAVWNEVQSWRQKTATAW
jgi:hypothetical protein